jgi:hypothetical protein
MRLERVVHVLQAAALGELADAVGGGDAPDAAGVDLEEADPAVQRQVFGSRASDGWILTRVGLLGREAGDDSVVLEVEGAQGGCLSDGAGCNQRIQ